MIANENGPRLWLRGPARWGGMVGVPDWQSGNLERGPLMGSTGEAVRREAEEDWG